MFYFGNAIGEAGNAVGNAIVNATDEILARNFPHGCSIRQASTIPYDYNRDGLVNGTDQIIARNNQTNPLTMLRGITAPAADALMQQTGGGESGVYGDAARLNWLFEFEQMNAKDRPAKHGKTAQQITDEFLALYGP